MSGTRKGEPRHIQELISFRIDDQEFCLDIMDIREIRGWTPATALPHAPDFVCGVINLRGTVLSIVDFAVRLGLRQTMPSPRHVIIVVQIGVHTVGLLVDAVCEILSVTQDTIQPTPVVASRMVQTFIRGVLSLNGRMISLVGLDHLLPNDEALATCVASASDERQERLRRKAVRRSGQRS